MLCTRTRGLEQRVNIDTAQPRIDKAKGLALRYVQVVALDEPGSDLNDGNSDRVDR